MKNVLILLAIMGCFGWIQSGRISQTAYLYDEADYMLAAGMGPAANWWDSPSRPITEFVSIGLAAVTHKSKTSLSQIAREGMDLNFYRHTHGPLYYYWLELVSAWDPREGAVRMGTLIFPLLTALVIFSGCVWLIPGSAGTRVASISTALFLWSPAVVVTGEIAPHLAFCCCVMGSLFCAAKAAETGSHKLWYAAWALAGLAMATLEVAFVLVLTLAGMAWRERQGPLHLRRAEMLRSVGALGAALLAVWPAGLLKLAFLKAYMFMAYLAVARRTAWGDVTFSGTWNTRFTQSPVEWLLIGAALALWVGLPRARSRQAMPFLLYGGLMVLTVLRVNTTSLRYALPFLPGLHVFAGMVLAGAWMDRMPARAQWTLTTVGIGLLGWNLAHFLDRNPAYPDTLTPAILQAAREQQLTDKRLLVPQDFMPSLHFYFPQATIKGFSDVNAETLTDYDAVLYPQQTQFSSPSFSSPSRSETP